jgi:hypothetical protein
MSGGGYGGRGGIILRENLIFGGSLEFAERGVEFWSWED